MAALAAGRRHYLDLIHKKEALDEEEWRQNPRWRTTNSDYGKYFVISRGASSPATTTSAAAAHSNGKTRNRNLQDQIHSPGPSLANPDSNHNQHSHHRRTPRDGAHRHCDGYRNHDPRLGACSIADNNGIHACCCDRDCDGDGGLAGHGHGHVEDRESGDVEGDTVDAIHGSVEPVDYVIYSDDNTADPWKQEHHWNDVPCDQICATTPLPLWNPKPLKPKILFENIARKMEKERQLERERLLSVLPLYKKMKSREWFQDRNPPRKQWQQSAPCVPMHHRQENKKYDYYKYYGYGGQGAKTSWGHNLPLGQKPPFSKRVRSSK